MNNVLKKETTELQVMEDNNINIDENIIKSKIYEIRGVQVMLDSDLALLYQCKNGTKDINKAVKRNIERFPDDFTFQLTKDEYNDILRFQFGTLEFEQGKYRKYLPFVFTEHGIIALASVLHSEIATKMSIMITRIFVAMRHFIVENKDNLLSINNINNRLSSFDNRLLNYKNILINTNNILINYVNFFK